MWLVFLRYSTNMISISLHVVSCVTPILNPYCRVQIFYPTLSAPLYTPQIKTCHVSIYLIKMLDLCYFFISIFLLFKFRWSLIKKKNSSYSHRPHHQLRRSGCPSTPLTPPVAVICCRQANTTGHCPLQFQTNFTATDETQHFVPLKPKKKNSPSTRMNFPLRCPFIFFKPSNQPHGTPKRIPSIPNSKPRNSSWLDSPCTTSLWAKTSSLTLMTTALPHSPNCIHRITVMALGIFFKVIIKKFKLHKI